MSKQYHCQIDSISYFNEDTRKLVLKLPEPVDFKAGQYLELMLPSKKCPFSIANAPHADNDVIELHIRPTPGSEDSVQIEKLLDSEALSVDIEMPKGDCFLEAAPHNPLILLAASTGVTQMKSIIEFLLPGGLKQPTYLYWGVVSDRDLYLEEVIRTWESDPDFHYVPVVSEPDTSPNWQGRTGLVGDAVLADVDSSELPGINSLEHVSVVVSGGPGMVYACLDAFVERGMPEDRMISDIFSYAPRNKAS